MPESFAIRMRAVTYQEGTVWVRQCLEHDIAVQASDPETLEARTEIAIMTELQTSLEMTGQPFGGIDPAPQRFFTLWEQGNGGLLPPPDGS